MEIKKVKKIGLISAISMLIASVIGIGIFLKNDGIFNNNGGNPIGILLSWIIGIIIALTTAYSFAEITSTSKSSSGLAGWSEKLLGRKFGYFVKHSLPTFYLSLLGVVLSIFMGETLFSSIESIITGTGSNKSTVHFGWIMLFTLFVTIFIYISNYLSIKTSGIFSMVANVVKFFPIIAIIVLSVVFSIINKDPGNFKPEFISPPNELNVVSILISIPSILFAFDSFLIVGNISNDIIKPKKNLPLAIVIGMVICAALYVIVTVGQLLAGSGNALEFFNKILIGTDPSVLIGLNAVMNIVIFIATAGVVNSICAGTVRSHAALINERVAFYSESIDKSANVIFKSHKNENSVGLISSMITYFFYWVIILLPSVIIGPNGNDHYVDLISNLPTLFFFLIYGITILGGVINRFTNKVEVTKYFGFIPVAITSFVLIIFIFSFIFFYQNIVNVIMDPNAKLSAGLFHNSKDVVTKSWQGSIVFGVFFAWFILSPAINLGFKKALNQELF